MASAPAPEDRIGRGLDPILRGLLDQMQGMPKLWHLPPSEARAAFLAMARTLDSQDIEIGRIENRTIPGPAGKIPLRIYTPAGADDSGLPGLVFFHGGGWVIGDLDTYDALCRRLANGSGARLVAVDYRLAPEHLFPAAVEDCHAAAEWVAHNAPALGIDPRRIAVAGDSAGGNLAAVTCLLGRERGGPRFLFQALFYPVTQARAETVSMNAFASGYFLEKEAMHAFLDAYAPGADPADWRLSPLAAPDHKGLPPALVVTAGFDPLRDEGRAYAEKLQRAGVPARHVDYPSAIHGFLKMSGILPVARAAIDDSASVLRAAFAA